MTSHNAKHLMIIILRKCILIITHLLNHNEILCVCVFIAPWKSFPKHSHNFVVPTHLPSDHQCCLEVYGLFGGTQLSFSLQTSFEKSEEKSHSCFYLYCWYKFLGPRWSCSCWECPVSKPKLRRLSSPCKPWETRNTVCPVSQAPSVISGHYN